MGMVVLALPARQGDSLNVPPPPRIRMPMPFQYLFRRLGLLGLLPPWDLRALELYCGLAAVGWAVMVLATDAWAAGPAYAEFQRVAPAAVWAVLMLATGAAQVVACVLSLRGLTRAASLLGVFAWAFAVCTLAHVSTRHPALPLYVLLGAACFWLHVKP